MSESMDRSTGWEHRVPLQEQLDEAEAEIERLTAQRDRLRKYILVNIWQGLEGVYDAREVELNIASLHEGDLTAP